MVVAFDCYLPYAAPLFFFSNNVADITHPFEPGSVYHLHEKLANGTTIFSGISFPLNSVARPDGETWKS